MKEELVAAKIDEIEESNNKKREQQETYKKERHLKEAELRRIYLDEYRDRMIQTMQHIKVGDNSYSIKDVAANEKLFDKLTSSSSVKYTYIDTSYYNNQTRQTSIDVDFSQIEKSIDPKRSYKERLKALRYTYEELEDIDLVDIHKEDFRSQPLSLLMNEVDYTEFPSYKSLKIPRLIEFLVVKGYIDENYYDYISYFYANFIDAHDWDFVLDLKLNKTHPYDYHINNVEACLNEIPKSVYRKNAILNIDLVDYLSEHQVDRMNKTRLLVILRTAVMGKKYDFLAEYYQKGCQQDVVFPLLYDQQKGLWSAFENKDDEKQSLKLSWFKYAEKEQSCDGSRTWLNDHFAFMTDNLLDIDAELWCTLIKDGEYKFKEVNEVSEDILKVVADVNAYKLSRHNMEVLVGSLLDMRLDSVSYTLVNQTEHEQLIDLVEENLGQCMKEVFASPESEKESVDAILGILLDAQVTDDEKMVYLKKQQNKINLEQAEQKDIKTLALKCDVVEISWGNAVHYLNEVSEKKADATLIAFVDKHADELAMQGIDQLPSDDVRNLLAQFISTDYLSYDSYVKIVGCFERWYYEKGIPSIEERRVRVLNEKGMIHYTAENTESYISRYSSSALIAYLLKHKREWLKTPEDVAYSTETAVGLMRSNLTIVEKTNLIPYFDVAILNEELSDEIIHLLDRQEVTLNKDFLLKVMKLTKMSGEKLRVLNYTLEKNVFDEDVITAFIETLHIPFKFIAEKGKKPEIPNDEESWRLVKVLKERDYISSYSETKKGIRVNTKLK